MVEVQGVLRDMKYFCEVISHFASPYTTKREGEEKGSENKENHLRQTRRGFSPPGPVLKHTSSQINFSLPSLSLPFLFSSPFSSFFSSFLSLLFLLLVLWILLQFTFYEEGLPGLSKFSKNIN